MEPVQDQCAVTTTLLHVSGEWIRGTIQMKPVKNDPQAVGSCITYARRYSLAAIVGVSPADDDGNAGSGRDPLDHRPPSERHQTANGAPTRPDNSRPTTLRSTAGSGQGAATAQEQPPLPGKDEKPPTTGAVNQALRVIDEPKVRALTALVKSKNIKKERWLDWLMTDYKFESIAKITAVKFQEIFDVVMNNPEKITGEKK
jgi:hypothetical protein